MNKNIEISALFDRIADSLDILDENPFKIRAYRNASRNIRELPEDIENIAEREELLNIPGIGKDLAEKVKEYIRKGKLEYYEELKTRIPEELTDLLAIQGIGPKMLSKLNKELHVRRLEDLEKALKGNEILDLHGMGKRKIEEIKRGIQLLKESKERINIGLALPLAEEIIKEIDKTRGTEGTIYAGSLRRMRETVGDIDILTMADDGELVIKAFTKLPIVKDILASGDTKGGIITKNGIQVDLRVVGAESYGAALQYFTGSKAHNVKLRTIALRKGLKINEYGVYKGEKRIAGETEKEVYKSLGLSLIPPEIREDKGEIEAAIAGKLPDLIKLRDIKGDLHTHSNWSDGRASIEEMALTAFEMGYEYIALTDHSPSSRIANGLSIERLGKKKKELIEVSKRIKGIKILMGAEVDIQSDGTLDYPDHVLKELDVVIASVHIGFKMDRDTMTKRITMALRNPHVHILAHPTGRLIGERDPYEVDLDEVFKIANEHGKAIEVNSSYLRLDLNDINIKKAIDMGTKIIISTDSHHTDQMPFMRLGVATARRGWAERSNVINTLDLKGLSRWLNQVRNE